MFCPLGAMKQGVQQKMLLHVTLFCWRLFHGEIFTLYLQDPLMLFNFCGVWGRGLGARTKLLGVSN